VGRHAADSDSFSLHHNWTQWNVSTDEELERLFEQYRRFASMNLRALLE